MVKNKLDYYSHHKVDPNNCRSYMTFICSEYFISRFRFPYDGIWSIHGSISINVEHKGEIKPLRIFAINKRKRTLIYRNDSYYGNNIQIEYINEFSRRSSIKLITKIGGRKVLHEKVTLAIELLRDKRPIGEIKC